MTLSNGVTIGREALLFKSDAIPQQQKLAYNQLSSLDTEVSNALEACHTSHLDRKAAESFWRFHLEDAPATSFPPHLSPKEQPAVTRCLDHDVAPFQINGVRQAIIIHAAWTLLVGMHLSSTDIMTGVTLDGFNTPIPHNGNETRSPITVVPFRTRFVKDQLLTKLLDSMHKRYLDMTPFLKLGIQNIRDLNESARAACSFNSILFIHLATENFTNKILHDREYLFSSLDCALLMECQYRSEGVTLQATFDENLLTQQRMKILLGQFAGLMRRIATSTEDMSVRVSDVQVICDAESTQIMGWNSNGVLPKSTDVCVHDLVERRAQSQPAAPAIHAWDGSLTYEALNKCASKLAAYLVTEYGVQPESLVPVCFEKSLWYVVSILAVMMAGGAYVPLDPKHPQFRMRAIIEDLGDGNSNLILTSHLHFGSLNALGLRLLAVGPALLERLAGDKSTEILTKPSNSCVVVFTSGSTGAPKNIVIEHRTLSTSLIEHGAFIGLGVPSRVLQFAAHTFDISIGDIFATLVYGGCICIPSEHDRMNNLADSMEAMNVNHANLTPTVASQLEPGETPSLNTLLFAGEFMQRKLAEDWADRITLINMYGPAETTIYCTGKADFRRTTEPSSIGQGIGALVWLTNPNDHNKLVPIGCTGEILIEGPTVARGYLGNEERTRAVFIEDPAWAAAAGLDSGRRLYKTGDLGYYNWDGSIAIVGRNDSQIKLHGQRIEIGEVEHQLKNALLYSADVAASIVTPMGGRTILAAFVASGTEKYKIMEPEFIRSRAGLRDFHVALEGVVEKMRAVLPSYMIPETFIPISNLPLSASGKIERNKLQAMASKLSSEELFGLGRATSKRHRLARPLTPIEKALQTLWQEILQRSNVRLDDNFFGLGGDSVTAMRLGALARKRGINITVERIFSKPILADLASTE